MLFFELFPAVFAVVALVIAVALFAVNRRALSRPDAAEPPRTPSRPSVSLDDQAQADGGSARRPSMRA